MLEVEISNAPTMEFSEAPPSWQKNASPKLHTVPTIAAHAFGESGYLVVAVSNLNLELDVPIKVKLPISSAKQITLHFLTGGPRDTNLDELNVELASKDIPAESLRNGYFEATIPAGKAGVFVFQN